MLDTTQAAARIGVTPATWRKYLSDGRAPKPDGRVGRSPWWYEQTIIDWQDNRPGPGVGGGRPAHKKQEQERDA